MTCVPHILGRLRLHQRHFATAARVLATACGVAAFGANGAADFAKDVEPVLVKRCSECHGPDKQKSELRLDSRAAAITPAKSGKRALVPGKPDLSELLERVASTDPDEVMPPKGARLTPEEIAGLRHWIEEGAVWPDTSALSHWAFRPVARPQPPAAGPETGVRNEIDRFIFSRLAKEGLAPQPEADRATLIRRVSFDLTGLPPSWSEVDAFERDPSPKAYEALVDRLLASPHYGENMARGWLDLARYADSNGYQVDLTRSMWPYRQWVIDAFNRNEPFSQFTIDQLAGDLLPNATEEQRIATGFNRNTKINDEGGGDPEEYRVKAVKDRVATLGTTWLGLTLNCAECHSHKYDPISQEEYYRLYAFFNNTTDGGNYSTAPAIGVPDPDLTEEERFIAGRVARVEADLLAEKARLAAEEPRWARAVAARGDVWRVLSLTNASSSGGSSYTNLPDGSLLAVGVNPIYDTITVEADTDLQGITAVLLEVLPDPSLPKNGPGRWRDSGNFILDEFSAAAVPRKGAAPASTNLVFAGAVADWEQPYYRAEHAIDRNPKTGWAIGPRFGQRHFLIARLKDAAGRPGGSHLTFRFDHYHGNSHALGRFRLSVTTEKNPDALWPVPSGLRPVVAMKPADRSADQARQLTALHESASPAFRAAERDLYHLRQRQKAYEHPKWSTLVMKERPEPAPRVTRVQNRGNFLDPGKEVTPGVPVVFPPLPAGEPANRLALAHWLVDPANPLTARVAVNRFWERCFGVGLVKTSEDFGRQGEAPSHPELLDWLASEFVRNGWDVKAMQKLIVMSAAYRQDAATDARRLEKDFYNRLVSRGPRFRLDAELIRDNALAVSGLLNPKVGGPSVYPVQPANLWKEIGFLRPEIGMDEWPVSEGPDLYRRGIYTFWRRVCTYPTFAAFDAPSREVCVARRPRTNTPLQALAGLNEPTLLEAARVFGQRILTDGGADDFARIDYAFHACLGRNPSAAERSRLLAFVKQQQEGYRRDAAAAEALVAVGSAPRPAGLEPRRLAPWMMLANVLFNLDETLTKG